MSKFEQIKWRDPDGNLIACVEKIKVMRENLEELQQMAQDCLEDALLMQCDERQVRQVLHQLIDSLHNPYMGE
jgi:nitrogen fixation/metabolism regulation signal transduction histidine kinase